MSKLTTSQNRAQLIYQPRALAALNCFLVAVFISKVPAVCRWCGARAAVSALQEDVGICIFVCVVFGGGGGVRTHASVSLLAKVDGRREHRPGENLRHLQRCGEGKRGAGLLVSFLEKKKRGRGLGRPSAPRVLENEDDVYISSVIDSHRFLLFLSIVRRGGHVLCCVRREPTRCRLSLVCGISRTFRFR